jgi:hypothetical protein
MKPTCNQTMALGHLLVSCKLVKYVRIMIKSFYLLVSVSILQVYETDSQL